MRLRAVARVDRRTKHLANRILPGEIAVICHRDLDGPTAQALIRRRVAAVVNAEDSASGRYPNQGPGLLLAAAIPVLDRVGPEIMDQVTEGAVIELAGDAVYLNGARLAQGEVLTDAHVADRMEMGRQNLSTELQQFVQNTLSFVTAEQTLLFEPVAAPELRTNFCGRQALVVVRGDRSWEDLRTIRSYIKDRRPVLIGVDGGADLLRDAGHCPDVIIGDMDSVSDETLRCGAELVVHAYAASAGAPGMARLERLGLTGHVFPAPGTSEDVALLLARDKGADLIVAVGTHFSLTDFLDKARAGMASTFLARLRVGSMLVDARGVSRLYRAAPPIRYFAYLVAAALMTGVTVILFSGKVQSVLRFLGIKLRLLLGI
jgi:uncharacterized membrane-anchored protein